MYSGGHPMLNNYPSSSNFTSTNVAANNLYNMMTAYHPSHHHPPPLY